MCKGGVTWGIKDNNDFWLVSAFSSFCHIVRNNKFSKRAYIFMYLIKLSQSYGNNKPKGQRNETSKKESWNLGFE